MRQRVRPRPPAAFVVSCSANEDACMKLLFITQYDERGASSRCRVYQYLPYLARRGIEGEVLPRLPSAMELWRRAGAVDGVFLQKRLPSLTRLMALRRRAKQLWFDFDNAIWLRRGEGGTGHTRNERNCDQRVELAREGRDAGALVPPLPGVFALVDQRG